MALPLTQTGVATWLDQPVDEDTLIVQSPGQEAEFISTDDWDSFLSLFLNKSFTPSVLRYPVMVTLAVALTMRSV